jgi:hypothetical protein
MHPLSDTTLKADEASFVLVRDAARDALRANPSLDGRAWWQPLKERLSDSPSTEWEWAPFDQEKAALRDSVLPLPDRRSDGSMIPRNHFMRELVRIPMGPPTGDSCSERKILQLALNAGFLLADKRKDDELVWEVLGLGMDELAAYVAKKGANAPPPRPTWTPPPQ